MAGYPGGYPMPGQQGAAYHGAPAGYPQQQQQQQQQYAPQQGYPGQQPGSWGGAPPGMDPQIYSWFVAVDQDRSGQINLLELQMALRSNSWSQFSSETCRLLITLFDRDNSGTINLNEFQSLWNYIQQWKQCFDRYDMDRSGNIEAAELAKVLTDMGYRVSPQIVNTILYKYDQLYRRSLKFDDFINVAVMMKNYTEAFRQRDVNQTGTVQLAYDDFLGIVFGSKP